MSFSYQSPNKDGCRSDITPNKLLKQKENTKTAVGVATAIALLNWLGCTLYIHKKRRTASKSMQYYDVAEIHGFEDITSKDISNILTEFERSHPLVYSTKLDDPPAAKVNELVARHKSKSMRTAMYNTMLNQVEKISKGKIVFSYISSKSSQMTIKKKVYKAIKIFDVSLNSDELFHIGLEFHMLIGAFIDNNKKPFNIDGASKELAILEPHSPILEVVWKKYGVGSFDCYCHPRNPKRPNENAKSSVDLSANEIVKSSFELLANGPISVKESFDNSDAPKHIENNKPPQVKQPPNQVRQPTPYWFLSEVVRYEQTHK